MNSIKNLYLISFLFLLVACGTDETEYTLPTDILTKEEIIPVLVDVQILESHFQRNFARTDLYRDALDSSTQSVFKDHNTTKEIFNNSMNYYSLMPDTLFTIYEAALDTINFRIDMGR